MRVEMNDVLCPDSSPWALVDHEGGLIQCYLSQEAANQALSEKGGLDPAEQNSAEANGETRAQWSTAFINNLPDSSFLYIEPGGKKDSDGKTTPRSLRHFPVKDADGNIDMPHLRNALSRIPQSSLPQSVKDMCIAKAKKMMPASMNSRPPRDELVRTVSDYHLRSEDGSAVVMTGRFTPFNEWTEIRSHYEGHFMERVSPTAFDKSFSESTPKVLFQHGQDPQIGEKPLGIPETVEARDDGAYYEVPLFDASYVQDLVPGLKAGAYGASFRFRVLKEDYEAKPKRTESNPEGIPQRTITEAQVFEFGPVTWPAYGGATAGVRSLSDRYLRDKLGEEPERPEPEKSTPEPEPDDSTPEGAASKRKEPLFGLPQEKEESWRL